MTKTIPKKNKWFRTKCRWCSYSTDGSSTEHGPCDILAVRYDKDSYSFIHKGQSYLYEHLGDFDTWEYI